MAIGASAASSSLTLAGAVSLLAFLVIMASGCVDVFGTFKVAGFSVQALLTVVYLFFGIILLIAIPTESFVPVRSIPFFLFLFWGVCSLLWTPALISGVQNLLVISNLLVLGLASEAMTKLFTRFAARIDLFLKLAVLVATAIYCATMLVYGVGTSEIIGARTFSLFALFGVVQQLARWRYGSTGGFFWAVILTVIIGISQSRLSLGIAVVMFPLAQWPTRRTAGLAKMVAVGAVALAVAAFSVFYFDALRERFFEGDVSLRVGDYAINGSGRAAFWDATIASFLESPVVGKGAGSAQYLVESVFVTMGHPHSDYIRVAHDYGVVGLFLWLGCLLSWTVGHFRYWRLSDQLGSKSAPFQLAALLSLISFTIQMLMENTLVYVFIAAPLGLLLGAAAGTAPMRRKPGWNHA